MHRFMHVTFSFAGVIKVKEFEPVFTAIGDDWIRYSPLAWILWTAKPAPHVYTLLSPHLATNDLMLISVFSTNGMFGRLQPWMWDWMTSKDPGNPIQQGQSADALTQLSADALKALDFDPRQ